MTNLQGNLLYLIILLTVHFIYKFEAIERKWSFQYEIIEDFKRLCPFTDLCFSTARENFTDHRSTSEYSCCQMCTCEEHCGNNCCPDKPEQFLNKSEVRNITSSMEQCVFAQLRPFSSSASNGKAYRIISNCPENYSDQNIIKKCSRQYHEFDFDNGDLKTLMPVSSSLSKSTFKIIYCAICNGVLKSDLYLWDTKVECDNGKKLSVTNISQIMMKLSLEPSCQVIFEPSASTPVETVETCDGIIDRCNVTGIWKTYDFNIESACFSYSSIYSSFKNIHCFLCNGHSINDIKNVCPFPDASGRGTSFVALLDFNDLERSPNDEGGTTKCSFDSRYDPYKKKCRPLSCPSGMQLSKGKCIPVYKEIKVSLFDVVYGLRFKLFPTQMVKESEWNNLLPIGMSLYDCFMSKMYTMLTTLNSDICAMNAYVKLNMSLEKMISLMHRENLTNFLPFVSYIAVIVDFSFKGVKNSSATLEELEMMFTSSNYYGQYNIKYSEGDIEMPPNSSIYNIGKEFMAKLNQLLIDPSQRDMIINGQTDQENKSGILTFPLESLPPKPICEPDLLIQPKPFCPRIELSYDEFEINCDNKKVSFLNSEASIEEMTTDIILSNILHSDRDGSVYVCSDEYFSQLPTENNKVSNVYDELIILTLVCLAFSIISLMITFIVYCILPMLRTVPGLNNMALVFHLFVVHTLFLAIAATEVKPSWLCSIVGTFLHFNLLSSFFWMFISTFHMMNAFVKIKEKSAYGHTLSKFGHYVIFTESASTILVISYIVVTITSGQDSEGFGYGGPNCYIKEANMILYFVALPLGVVITANLGMFSYVIWSVSRMPDMAHNSNHERHNLLIFAKLSTLTGITWVFGFLYQFTNVFLFAYLYIVFNASQGVFIMISFVNKRTLNMLRSHIYTNTNDNTKSSTQSTRFTKSTMRKTNSVLNDTDIKF